MPYVGNDWSDVSSGQNVILTIDMSPYLVAGDSFEPLSIAREFYPVIGDVPDYADIPQGNPYMTGGQFANQVINLPPGTNRYLLGFTCSTANGQLVELWSYFWGRSKPPVST